MQKKSAFKPPDIVAALAGKLSSEREEWLPLWLHSLDTCAVAERLFLDWLSKNARSAIGGSLPESDLLTIVRTVGIMHDLGKATALFQTQISKDCTSLSSMLTQADIPVLSSENVVQQKSYHFYHAQAGETLLIQNGCPLSIAEIIGAHHGKPWPEGNDLSAELQETNNWVDPRSNSLWGNSNDRSVWQQIQKDCLQWMMETAECKSLPDLPEIPQPAAMLLTGLLIMADWIASNESYFPLLSFRDSDVENITDRHNTGWQAIHLPLPWKPYDSFEPDELCRDQFGFEANALQKTLIETVQNSAHSGLYILEAPMGLGKTEAALLAANLFARQGAGGIFFGLPTQATANAIFDRVAGWAEKQPEENRLSIRLAHGMADLNEHYRSLMAGSSASNTEEDSNSEHLIIHEWFRGRKQALLADFVVGTVDQVLMAALKQKHIMLRHLGLCGKTVIIDECHAYDAYMNQYLEETLRWLGSYKTPVIMLSATLPADRRAAFLAAYMNKSQRTAKKYQNEPWYKNLNYPVLTWSQSDEVHQKHVPYDGEIRTVQIRKLTHNDDLESQERAAMSLIQEKLSNGGCAAVILNTVKRAQCFAEFLRSELSDMKALLLHSRFVATDRLKLETEMLRHMGKESDHRSRFKTIVIGTQVIEQSLDYDADIMISDLCPMDLLLQRIGRLHRHKIHDQMRPDHLRTPECYVLCAGDALDKGSIRVYGEYLLMRTKAFLPETLTLPDDIPVLVNKVYDEDFPLPEVPEKYERAKSENRVKEEDLKNDAKAFRIHGPDKGCFSTLLEGSVPPDEEHAKAQVRAGDISLDVILLVQNSSGNITLLPWLSDSREWNTSICPSEEDCRTMLAQHISLSAGLLKQLLKDMKWEELINSLSVPKAWEVSPWLRREHLLLMNEQLETKLGSCLLTYIKDIGLQWRKDGEHNG